jgi:hypothetical protein
LLRGHGEVIDGHGPQRLRIAAHITGEHYLSDSRHQPAPNRSVRTCLEAIQLPVPATGMPARPHADKAVSRLRTNNSQAHRRAAARAGRAAATAPAGTPAAGGAGVTLMNPAGPRETTSMEHGCCSRDIDGASMSFAAAPRYAGCGAGGAGVTEATDSRARDARARPAG